MGTTCPSTNLSALTISNSFARSVLVNTENTGLTGTWNATGQGSISETDCTAGSLTVTGSSPNYTYTFSGCPILYLH